VSLWMLLMITETCRSFPDNLLEHGGGQPPRIRVLPRAVITIAEDEPGGERVTRAVGEGVSASLELEGVEDAVMGDAADCKQGSEMGEGRYPRDKELPAGRNLFRRRLVLRRHAAHGVGDHAIDELK
jgi:hypothetical protein